MSIARSNGGKHECYQDWRTQNPNRRDFPCFFDKSSGQVKVGSEYAGQASTESEAMRKADHYATTGHEIHDGELGKMMFFRV